ncbi:MAG TPA: rhomboid family intramembrane serine protease [Gaiellaceae bacterium]|nr:rhomboid family intramembrane serine protease [Gaiellaceae bacterium]
MSTAEPRYCYRHPDRETGLSCSECGRPICADCATFAPVGIRCPDHAGARGGKKSRQIKPPTVHRAEGVALATGSAPITKALIAANVAIYLITVEQGGGGLNNPGGSLLDRWILYGPLVIHGGWYRLVTNMFLHANLLHIGFNMYALWIIGTPVEQYLGRVRYLGLYFVSGLAGSAGALVLTPHSPTLGASGAVFGVLGSMMILEWQITGRLAGNAMTWIAINLVVDFVYNGFGGAISIGGHIGGAIGGILITLGYAHWRGGRAQYGQLGLEGLVGLVAVAAASVAIAYFKVRGYQ